MESIKTKRAVMVEKGRIEIESAEIFISEEQVLVKNVVCGMCSTDILSFKGEYEADFPKVFGHEAVGIVEYVGKNVNGFKAGDKVTGFWIPGFSEFATAFPSQMMRLPENCVMEYAVGEPLACVANIIRTAAVEFGDYVMVIGCGGMGLTTIAGLKNSGASEIVAVDVLDNKLHLAKELGATITINSSKENIFGKVDAITSGHGMDIAIEVTGRSNCIDIAGKSLRQTRGRLLIASALVEPQTCNIIVWCQRGIDVYTAHPARSLSQMDDLRRALLMLEHGVFPMDRIITHKFEFNDIQNAYDTFMSKPTDYIKGIIRIR